MEACGLDADLYLYNLWPGTAATSCPSHLAPGEVSREFEFVGTEQNRTAASRIKLLQFGHKKKAAALWVFSCAAAARQLHCPQSTLGCSNSGNHRGLHHGLWSVVQWFIHPILNSRDWAVGQGPVVWARPRQTLQTLQTLHTLQTELSILHSDGTKIKHG